jgi:hypothetical protein
MRELGKRRTAVLAVLADRRRAPATDIVTLAGRDHGVTLSLDGAIDCALDLEAWGLAEKDAPHMDRWGKLQSTWRPTAEGDSTSGASRGTAAGS